MPHDDQATRVAPRSDAHTMRVVRARVVVVGGADDGATCAIGPAGVVVGSGASCDLEIDDALVSRRHLAIRQEPDGLRLEDLGSRNGTFVGAMRVREVWIATTTVVRVGDTQLRVEVSGGEDEVDLYPDVRFGGAIGVSRAMRHVFGLLAHAARHPVTVLLEGDSGTGKDVLANALHAESDRRDAPFVVLDCSAIPRELVESELFGHEKGSFTGAHAARRGAFEEAHGGTLFLDEIGELPLEMQPKLLRALENRSFRRVGGAQTLAVDVRVVAATNRRLQEAVRRKEFREDLFYRLGVVHILVPPLRSRPEDVGPLAEQFLRRFTRDATAALPAELLRLLESYGWPGNARELRNVVERFATLGRADPAVLFGARERADVVDGEPSPLHGLESLPYHEAKTQLLDVFHRVVLPKVLEREGGSISRAADQLGIPRTSLHRMLQKLKDERGG